MENSGFYNDNYSSGSSDDDLVDLSVPAHDLLQELPYDKQDYGQGMRASQNLCSTSSTTFTESSCGLCCILNVNGEKSDLDRMW